MGKLRKSASSGVLLKHATSGVLTNDCDVYPPPASCPVTEANWEADPPVYTPLASSYSLAWGFTAQVLDWGETCDGTIYAGGGYDCDATYSETVTADAGYQRGDCYCPYITTAENDASACVDDGGDPLTPPGDFVTVGGSTTTLCFDPSQGMWRVTIRLYVFSIEMYIQAWSSAATTSPVGTYDIFELRNWSNDFLYASGTWSATETCISLPALDSPSNFTDKILATAPVVS